MDDIGCERSPDASDDAAELPKDDTVTTDSFFACLLPVLTLDSGGLVGILDNIGGDLMPVRVTLGRIDAGLAFCKPNGEGERGPLVLKGLLAKLSSDRISAESWGAGKLDLR